MRRILAVSALLLTLLLPLLCAACQPSPATITSVPSPTPVITGTPASPQALQASITSPAPSTAAASTPKPGPQPIVWTKPGAPVTLTVDAVSNRATYKSDDSEISGYFYKPQGAGPFPAVLVLHGKGGLGEPTRAYASWLATQGYVALAPDYLKPIGMSAGAWAGADYGKYTDRIREILGYGVESLKSLSYVSPNRFGVVGMSLGGFFAFVLATRDDLKGIVSYYGAYAPWLVNPQYPLADIIAQIKTPVLMFHGDKDELVPIEHAVAARDFLTSSGKQFEYIVYPGAGHAFDIQGGATYDAAATADARQKVVVFLQARLK